MSRPSTPGASKINITDKDDFNTLMSRYEVSNSVGSFLAELTPPIDAIRSFANAFESGEELTKDLMGPLNIASLPDNVRLSARGTVRGLWDECVALTRAYLDGKVDRETMKPKDDIEEDKLDPGFRKTRLNLSHHSLVLR